MADYKYQPAAPITSSNLKAGGADLNYVWPNGPSRCTWRPGADLTTAPHIWQSHEARPEILPNVLHAIGHTPMIRLNNIPKSFGIECEVFAKCEFFNPGGSVKDRIAFRMVEDAEKRGLLKPGDTIIEPTSGNTGIGLAMAAAVKGYRCIIVMPWKMSAEKVNTLQALGAEIIRTPTAAGFDSPEGLIAVAQKISRETRNSIILDQYRNSFNPIAHYENTGQEILDQCGGKVDAVVCGAGTGGTITGIGRKIKDACPSCTVIAADPLGSSLSLPEELNKTDVSFYEVEGIGYDFIPTCLDRSVVDVWYKTNDADSLPMARRLIREEGLLCGGSSGTAMCIAMDVAKSMKAGQRLVVLLPDGMRNYMTKFVNDSWMQIRQLQPLPESTLWWANLPATSLSLQIPQVLEATELLESCLSLMKVRQIGFLFAVKTGDICGVLSTSRALTLLSSGKVNKNDTLESVVVPVRKVDETSTLQYLSTLLELENVAIVKSQGTDHGLLVTSQDLLNFITSLPQ